MIDPRIVFRLHYLRIMNVPELNEPTVSPPRSYFVREILEMLLMAALLYWGVDFFVGRVAIDGPSMIPTVTQDERLFVNNVAYAFELPERGDIVVLRSHQDNKNLIKRVIGLPGDHIRIADEKVWVNNIELTEPYLNVSPTYAGEWTIGSDEVFILGDNRNISYDSHNYGPIPMENIFGKAVVIYWPPEEVSFLEHYPHFDR